MLLSLVCASKKDTDFYEVKVDVQKEALRLRENIDNKRVGFIHFTFSFIVFIWSWSLMTTMFLLVRLAFGF